MTVARLNKKYILTVLVLLVVLCGLFYAFTAFGVTRTWDGGGGDANWHTPANWSGDTVPGASDIAAFDGTCVTNCSPTMNGVVSVAGISMDVGYTATITQSSTSTLTVGSSHWVQAGGVFIGGTSTIDINGTFTLSGGTFTSTAGTLEVGRQSEDETFFTVSGGTFNHSSGMVKFAPSFPEFGNRNFTIDVNTTLTLFNVEVYLVNGSAAANNLGLASGDTIVVLNDITLTDGTLYGTWEVQGNVTIASTADGGDGTLTYTGTGSKYYTYSGGGRGPHLRVNNAAVAVAPNTGTTDLAVSLFSLLAGSFTAPTGTMQVGRQSAPSGGETVFMISSGTFSHSNGTVRFVPANYYGGYHYFTVDVPTTSSFFNVNFDADASSGVITLAPAGANTIVVAGNFIQTNGTLAGTWEVQGNYTVGAGADGGTAGIAFTGGNNQTYTDNGGNEPDGDVTINKSGGTVTLASNADWNATNQDLTITSGTLAQSSYNITTNNFTVNGGTFTGGSGTTTTAGPMLVSSGTFTGGSGTADLGDTFTLSGGTFTAPVLMNFNGVYTGTFYAINVSGGAVFNHGNGTISINKYYSYDGPDCVVDVPTTITFNNFIVSVYGGTTAGGVTAAAGDTIIIANNFTQADGLLGGTWEVQGNVTIGPSSNGGLGTLTMTGIGAKTYTFTGGQGPHLRINNAGITATPSVGTTDLSIAAFSLMAGSFIAPTSSMNIVWQDTAATIFSVSNGTSFNHNNGTVNFYMYYSYDSQAVTIDVPTVLTLYNVSVYTVHGAGSGFANSITTAGGDTVIVANNFTHTYGVLDGTWEVQGNYSIGAGADGGSAGISFTGGNTQTYTDLGGNEPDGDITINKTANAVVLNSNADWNATNQDLNITSGTLLQRGTTSVLTGAVTVGASGKWIANGTGTTTLGGNLVNNGLIDYRGNNSCGGADILKLRSSSNGVQRSWSGSGTTIMRDVDVKDQGGSLAITANSCTNTSGNGANWIFTDACVFVGPDLVIPNTPMRIGSGRTVIQ